MQTTDHLKLITVDGIEWEKTTSDFHDIRQEQLNTFISNRWPQLESEYCLFETNTEKTRVIAGAAVMIAKLPLSLGGVAIIKWGPILREGKDQQLMKETYQQCIDQLIQRYAIEQNLLLSILPLTLAEPREWQQSTLIDKGFAQGKGLSFPDRYFVNLTVNSEEQRKSYGSKWRYHLKKSEKGDLVFIHETSDKTLEIFLQLYQKMTDRKQFPDYSAVETLPDMMAITDSNLRPEIFLVNHSGKTVAAAVIFKAGDNAVYLYGATSDQALPLRAGYFLHDRIINWLSENTQATWYDLGGNDGFSGLHQFKKGMVGKSGKITEVPALYTYGHTFKSRTIGRGLFMLKDWKTALQQRIEQVKNKQSTGDLS